MPIHDLSRLPSVDRLLRQSADLIRQFGRTQVTSAFRARLGSLREDILAGRADIASVDEIRYQVEVRLKCKHTPSLKPLLNLTGTVLHTNLGRTPLPTQAIDAIVKVATGYCNLEYDLVAGCRGDRDVHVEGLLVELTGAQAATVVNNNAAALLLCLSTLARSKQVPVSRGELVEIGGSFRIPEVMRISGCKLVEIGTTNRTHLRDYQAAINPETAMLLKVHSSNYAIQGFTKSVTNAQIATLAHEYGLAALSDLGSGSLLDLTQLPPEPLVRSAIEDGMDMVTFSGDKLLGGPQCGIIVGKQRYIDRIKQNPLKRALRVDKMTLAGLAEVLRLYQMPDQLQDSLPALRYLSRGSQEIKMLAEALLQPLTDLLQLLARVEVCDLQSKIGSGAMPLALLPSHGIKLTPLRSSDRALQALSLQFRGFPVPVLGRINDGALYLDLRTLDSPTELLDQVATLK